MGQSSAAPSSDPQTTAVLKARVERYGLAWLPDQPLTETSGRRLVIGAAAWSIYDIRLLMFVRDAVASSAQSDLDVAVFDVDELPTSTGLQRLFPNIGEVFHTPVAGYWEAGQLKEAASGFAARQLIGRLLGHDPKCGLDHYTAG